MFIKTINIENLKKKIKQIINLKKENNLHIILFQKRNNIFYYIYLTIFSSIILFTQNYSFYLNILAIIYVIILLYFLINVLYETINN